MSEIIDQFYTPLLIEHGFIHDPDNQQYGAREALPPRRLRRGRGRCDHRRAGLTGNPGKLEKTVDKCPCFVIF